MMLLRCAVFRQLNRFLPFNPLAASIQPVEVAAFQLTLLYQEHRSGTLRQHAQVHRFCSERAVQYESSLTPLHVGDKELTASHQETGSGFRVGQSIQGRRVDILGEEHESNRRSIAVPCLYLGMSIPIIALKHCVVDAAKPRDSRS